MVSLGREECGRLRWLSPPAWRPAAVVYCSMTVAECCDLEPPLDVEYCSITDLPPPDAVLADEDDFEASAVLICL